MELRNYIKILSRRKWIIIFTFIATLIVAAVGTYATVPVYQATTTLRVAVSAGGIQNSTSYTYNDQLMNTYVEIAMSTPVLEELMKQLNMSALPKIKAEVVPNTELIKITVEATNPGIAAAAANSLANILIAQSDQLYTGGGKTSQEVLAEQLAQAQTDLNQTQQHYENLLVQTPPASGEIDVTRQLVQLKQSVYAALLTQYQQASMRAEIQTGMITVVEPAVAPKFPSQPQVVINLALGIVVGLIGGLGLAFLFENLDNRLYNTKDIENASGGMILAEIPKTRKAEVIPTGDGYSPLLEACRGMAGNLLQAHQQAGNIFLVLSAEPDQGTTTIVTNLATALTEYGKHVVMVDCNVHMPQLHNLFNIPSEPGLRDVLQGKIDLKKALQNGPRDDLQVLTSGENSTNLSQPFASTRMSTLLNELSKQFDYVLLDAPALLAVADSIALARQASSLILVVRAGYARREAVYTAEKILAPFHDKFLGTVVNQENENGNYNYQEYKWKATISKDSAASL